MGECNRLYDLFESQVLIKSAGKTVGMIKMDPYLQIDAGTMSPYEHGEVFVTQD